MSNITVVTFIRTAMAQNAQNGIMFLNFFQEGHAKKEMSEKYIKMGYSLSS
jgi:hypothetical protein